MAVALKLAPRDARIASSYREVAAALALRMRRERERENTSDTIPPLPGALPAPLDTPPPESQGELVERVERLSAAHRAEPDNTELALELVDAMMALERDQEAHAVLSARLEDASPAEREALAPRAREVLVRLAEHAREAGRDEEASLYDDERRRLE